LTPGKRGRYTIRLVFWSGWDKAFDREIGADDPLPGRPWLCLWYTEIVGSGHSRVDWRRAPLCFVSTHVLSRMAQRHDMRTLEQMLLAITRIALAVLVLVQDKGVKESLNPPPSGWHIALDGGAELVLCRHDEKQVLVAVTCL
jgi:hypothetical protein